MMRAYAPRRIALAAALGGCLAWLITSAASAQTPTIRVELGGKILEGQPVFWSNQSVQLLARDGSLTRFAPHDAHDFRQLNGTFRALSQGELRGQLQREFGRSFQVSGTGHYLVVHPAGQRDQWAPRFEELYRSFGHYFTTRGFRPQEPEFPLVAVVFPTRQDFDRYARMTGETISSSVLGYYSSRSNRILLYDVTADQSGLPWYVNAETIIHEATHQTAFNTAVHSRFAPPPRWVAEGLGTLFEARGVWDSPHYQDRGQRINRYQLAAFQQYAAQRPTGTLAEFIAGDRAFQIDSQKAYAEAWALTFFLTETQPGKYAQYLQRTATREPFSSYVGPQRVKDFTSVFGNNLAVLEAHYLRFIQSLKVPAG